MNPIRTLSEYGQSVWLDYIRRGLITSGELKRQVEEDGLAGITSNPSIFEKAITGSTDYTDVLETLQRRETDVMKLYEALAIRDIQDAADVLRPVYKRTNGRDGYVSLEVSPYMASDTRGTIEEVKRLQRAVERDNLMLKVPATPEGIPAIERLIGEGININVTLLFSREAYARVAEAYIRGLERLAARGGDVSRVASVASFFISRIDQAVDRALSSRLKDTRDDRERVLLDRLSGRVAVANAKLAYRQYKEIFAGDRWQALEERGGRTQRLLWASTSTKNPNYSDVLYVEELIGADTVNTIPPSTYEAFKRHGHPRLSLEEGVEDAEDVVESLDRTGISLTEITDKLLDDGVRLFAEAFGKLLNALDRRCREAPSAAIDSQECSLPQELDSRVRRTLEEWRVNGGIRRIWSRDASLWTRANEADCMGWLGISEIELKDIEPLKEVAEEVRREGFSHCLVLGMGGSSLCPEVLSRTFGEVEGYPEVLVLDSTDPDQIRAYEGAIDLDSTLFIVASKSGTTLEPNILMEYFLGRIREETGRRDVGDRFIAITDPGSALEGIAEREGFRRVFHGVPSIGGRYSALSNFGMVPAALMGVDVQGLLDRAGEMEICCSPCLPVEENPGAVLGMTLGALYREGRDKVTVIASPGIRDFGAWLEQLLAESTGKDGKGLIPIVGEPPGQVEVYGDDRLFIYVRLDSAPDASQDQAVDALEVSGRPVVRIHVRKPLDLGGEFFRWMFATAVAGAVMEINPFDQPDVESSKVAAREMTEEYETKGTLPCEIPFYEEEQVKLFADPENVAILDKEVGDERSLTAYLGAHFNRLEKGDYFAVLAYLERNDAVKGPLQDIRLAVRDHKRVATILGFGPRFLHSTGQLFKGGPNNGLFLQVTGENIDDLQVPGRKFTFGVVKAAQARGDHRVLAERGRRFLRVHLATDLSSGLTVLREAVKRALG